MLPTLQTTRDGRKHLVTPSMKLPSQSGYGESGRTMRMRWSKKVACTVGTSTCGMWQVMQLDLACGQIFGVVFSCDLSSGAEAVFSTKCAAELFCEIAAILSAFADPDDEDAAGEDAADEWQVRHLAS